MEKLAVMIALAVGWHFAGPDGVRVDASKEVRAEVVRQGPTIRSEQTARRRVQVRLPQGHRGVDCHDGLDRCNLAPGFVTPGVQYHDLGVGR